ARAGRGDCPHSRKRRESLTRDLRFAQSFRVQGRRASEERPARGDRAPLCRTDCRIRIPFPGLAPNRRTHVSGCCVHAHALRAGAARTRIYALTMENRSPPPQFRRKSSAGHAFSTSSLWQLTCTYGCWVLFRVLFALVSCLVWAWPRV